MRSRKKWAWLLVVSLFWTLGASGLAGASTHGEIFTPFYDITGTPHQRAVEWLYPLKVVRGVSFDRFGGSEKVNRAQMAAFAVRALGAENKTAQGTTSFPDVPAGHWAHGVIQLANEMGIVRGSTDGNFYPNREVTQAEAIAMLIRALGYESEITDSFPIGHVLKAREVGLLEGMPRLNVGDPATRGDVAILLANAIFQVSVKGSQSTLSQTLFKVPAALRLAPTADYVVKGSTQLTAEGVDYAGKPFPVAAAYKIIAGQGVVSSDGVLHVTQGDTITVEASSGGRTAFRTYNVITGVKVTPEAAIADLNQRVNFKAVGVTGSGSEVAISPKWATSGGATVTPDGAVIPTRAGAVTVTASFEGLSASATILAGVTAKITPEKITLTSGGQQQFKLETNAAVPLTPAWKASSGIMSPDGLFTATSGDATVEATIGTIKATAEVTVIKELVITPGETRVSRGGTVSYKAVGRTSSGQTIDVTPSWSMSKAVGIIGRDGSFVATSPGTADVTATYGALTAKVPVNVVGEPVGLRVSASQTSAPANGTTKVTLKAWAADVSGNIVVGAVPSIRFATNNSLAGTLSSTEAPTVNGVAEVTFTPSTQSATTTIFVSDSIGSLPGANIILNTYPPVPARVELVAYPEKIAGDGQSLSTITARLVDNTGAQISNSTGTAIIVNLGNTNTQHGNLTSNVIAIPINASSGSTTFRASTALGTSRITGSTNYPVTDTQVTTVLVGAASKVHISRDITEVVANNQDEMVIKVEVQDASGYVRTSEFSLTMYLEYGPENQQPGLATAPVLGGVATFRIKSTKSGTHKLVAYASNLALTRDETKVTFKPGPAARLVLSADPTDIVPADRATQIFLVATITDAFNNKVPTASASVKFRKSANNNGTELASGDTVATVEGVARVPITGTAFPATDQWTATAEGLTTVGTSGAIIPITSRILSTPVRLDIQPASAAKAGEAVTVKVHVRDINGYVNTNVSGRTVYLTTNSSSAVVTGNGSVVNGVATFTVTNTRAENVTLTATSPGLNQDTGDVITWTPGSPTKIALKTASDALTADGVSSTSITAELIDAYGNKVNTAEQVQLSLSTSTAGRLTGTNLTANFGNVNFISSTAPGTVTITGTARYPVDPITIRTAIAGTPVRVRVEQPANVVAGNAIVNRMTLKVRIEDENGNVVTSLNTGTSLTAVGVTVQGKTGEATISINGTEGLPAKNFNADGLTTGASVVVNGTATLYYTNKKAETVTFVPVVYFNGNPLTVVSAQGTTVPGPVHHIAVSPVPVVFNAATGGTIAVRATVADLYGNPVATVGDTMRFSIDNANVATVVGEAAIQSSDGSATVTVQGKASSTGGKAKLTITSDKSGVAAAEINTVADLVPAPPAIYATDNNGTDYVVSSGDLGVRVDIVPAARQLDQTIIVQVDGVIVPLYASTAFTDLAVTTLPAGSTSVYSYYIRKQDLGYYGTKQIRASLSSSLGISPLTSPVQITYQQ